MCFAHYSFFIFFFFFFFFWSTEPILNHVKSNDYSNQNHKSDGWLWTNIRIELTLCFFCLTITLLLRSKRQCCISMNYSFVVYKRLAICWMTNNFDFLVIFPKTFNSHKNWSDARVDSRAFLIANFETEYIFQVMIQTKLMLF